MKDKIEQEVLQEKTDEEKKISPIKVSVIILILVLFLFFGVLLFTGILESIGGKPLETAGLILVAIILGALLYKTNRS